MRFIWIYIFLLCSIINVSLAAMYAKVKTGGVNYMVHFISHRGICSGFMVARNVVMTAAFCVYDPVREPSTPRSLNVVLGAPYRHARRGVKVQVTKILVPKFPRLGNKEDTFMEKAPAVLLLKRKVPDIITDVPVRAMDVNWKYQPSEPPILQLHEQCFLLGWHFHGLKDKIYQPGNKFLLQRHLRYQMVYVVKNSLWCEELSALFQKKLDSMGFEGIYDPDSYVCTGDGMYGSPLICQGKAVGMMMSQYAQRANCSGFSNIIHLFASKYLVNYMHCVSSLFSPDPQPDWNTQQTMLYDEPPPPTYDYVPEMYDTLVFDEDQQF